MKKLFGKLHYLLKTSIVRNYNAKTYFKICKFGSSSPQSILFINNKKYE